ncbi:hypothetical protein H8E88_22350 [candidate division KSB1 bacterium]|nr:hypothetical protein [candidate division KSB1 bacterium]
MEAIKQTVKTPRSHEVCIKIPQHVPENDPVEIILVFGKESNDFNRKISKLKSAMSDELFLGDLKEVSDEFERIDIEEWDE